jgi:hypothetical protein
MARPKKTNHTAPATAQATSNRAERMSVAREEAIKIVESVLEDVCVAAIQSVDEVLELLHSDFAYAAMVCGYSRDYFTLLEE